MPDELPVSYEDRGDYVFWDMTDWTGDFDVLADLEAEWKDVNSAPSVDGSVVVLNEDLSLGPEFQDHITETWSSLTQEADVDRIAFVSDQVTAMAVKANIDFPGVDVQATGTVEEAVEWVEQ